MGPRARTVLLATGGSVKFLEPNVRQKPRPGPPGIEAGARGEPVPGALDVTRVSRLASLTMRYTSACPSRRLSSSAPVRRA
jgi:hypothetical protein